MSVETMTRWRDDLAALHPCKEATDWARAYPTLEAAWQACERGDWMLWLVGRTEGREAASAGRKRLVLCACACARTALRCVPAGETRPLAAIDMAERWARGDGSVTLADVRRADAYAAYAAYAAAYAADAAYAACAAADAADAAYAAAKTQALKTCAEIVRQHYPDPPVLRRTEAA